MLYSIPCLKFRRAASTAVQNAVSPTHLSGRIAKKNEATELGWCNVQCALPPGCCKMRTHEEVVRAPPPGSLSRR